MFLMAPGSENSCILHETVTPVAWNFAIMPSLICIALYSIRLGHSQPNFCAQNLVAAQRTLNIGVSLIVKVAACGLL